MILSSGRRYVFIHIPKTAGTSLALALESRAMKDDIMLGDTPKARRRRHRVKGMLTRGRLWKHSTLADIEGLVDQDVLNGLYVFTLVRNPWDRVVSYYHWLREQQFNHSLVALAQTQNFA
ncbi:MAG: sulfotransferase family protein, partial [Rhodobacteraceae bacterium]|nr:sulfotransferase family protein [Paracoccaceae bacterium]